MHTIHDRPYIVAGFPHASSAGDTRNVVAHFTVVLVLARKKRATRSGTMFRGTISRHLAYNKIVFQLETCQCDKV